jgi:hypothetical protein
VEHITTDDVRMGLNLRDDSRGGCFFDILRYCSDVDRKVPIIRSYGLQNVFGDGARPKFSLTNSPKT